MVEPLLYVENLGFVLLCQSISCRYRKMHTIVQGTNKVFQVVVYSSSHLYSTKDQFGKWRTADELAIGKRVWKTQNFCMPSFNYTLQCKGRLKDFLLLFFPPCLFCRRKGRHLNFQMDLLLQESLLKKKAIMLDLNFRELEGVFTSLNEIDFFLKEIKVINLHLND